MSKIQTEMPVFHNGVDITEGVELEKEKIDAINTLIVETEKTYQENDKKARDWFTKKPLASIPQIVRPKVAISFTLFALTITITWNLLTPFIPKPEPTPIYFMEEDQQYDVAWPTVDRHDLANAQQDTIELKSLRKITFEDDGPVFNVSEYTYKEQMNNVLIDKTYKVNQLNENNTSTKYELQKSEYFSITPPNFHYEIMALLENSIQNSKVTEIKNTLLNFKYYVHNVDAESEWIYRPGSPKENAIYFASQASAESWGDDPFFHVARTIGTANEYLLYNSMSERGNWWYPSEGLIQALGEFSGERAFNTYTFDGNDNTFVSAVSNNCVYTESYINSLMSYYNEKFSVINNGGILYELLEKVRAQDTGVLDWLKGKVYELENPSTPTPSTPPSTPSPDTTQTEYSYNGNADTRELYELVDGYNAMVENMVYDSNIQQRLRDLDAKKESILSYVNSHTFLDDGKLEQASVEFDKIYNSSTQAISEEIAAAEEKYRTKISEIIKKYGVEDIRAKANETPDFLISIYSPVTWNVDRDISLIMNHVDYKPQINEINESDLDQAIANEINNKISSAFVEAFSQLTPEPKTVSSFKSITDITDKYKSDGYTFLSQLSGMVDQHNALVSQLANRGLDFPNYSEMQDIAQSEQAVNEYANSLYLRVPNKELDAEIARQMNAATEDSKVPAAEISNALSKFEIAKQQIFSEYGYKYNDLPKIDDDWKIVYDVSPTSNKLNETVYIPFDRITYEPSLALTVITTTIRNTMVDGDVYLSK